MWTTTCATPFKDARARQRLAEWNGEVPTVPIVELLRDDGDGSVFLINPDEPTLRQSLYSENILSITAYWVLAARAVAESSGRR